MNVLVHVCIGVTANMADPRHIGVKSNMADSPRAAWPLINEAKPHIIAAKPQIPGKIEKMETSTVARAAWPLINAAKPQIPGTIETMKTSSVPIVQLPHATPRVAGSAEGEPITHMAEHNYTLI